MKLKLKQKMKIRYSHTQVNIKAYKTWYVSVNRVQEKCFELQEPNIDLDRAARIAVKKLCENGVIVEADDILAVTLEMHHIYNTDSPDVIVRRSNHKIEKPENGKW